MCHNEVYKCLVCSLFVGQDTEHCAASEPTPMAGEFVNCCRRENTCDSWVIHSGPTGCPIKIDRGTGLFTKTHLFPVYTTGGLVYVRAHNFVQLDVICHRCKQGPRYKTRPTYYEKQCNWIYDPFGSPFPIARIRWEECRDRNDMAFGRTRWVTRHVVPGLGFYGTDLDDEFQQQRYGRPLQPTYESRLQAYPLERILFAQGHPASLLCYQAPPSEMWGGYDPARSPLIHGHIRTVATGGRFAMPRADSGYSSTSDRPTSWMQVPTGLAPVPSSMLGPLARNFVDSGYAEGSAPIGNTIEVPAHMPEPHPGMFGPLPGTIVDPALGAAGPNILTASTSTLPAPLAFERQAPRDDTGKSSLLIKSPSTYSDAHSPSMIPSARH